MTTTQTMTATFRPQAWVNDNAVDVDPAGPVSWTVSASYLDELTARYGAAVTHSNTNESDMLRDDPAAPGWVRGWSGPFVIELEVA